jgi:hypothetical protein
MMYNVWTIPWASQLEFFTHDSPHVSLSKDVLPLVLHKEINTTHSFCFHLPSICPHTSPVKMIIMMMMMIWLFRKMKLKSVRKFSCLYSVGIVWRGRREINMYCCCRYYCRSGGGSRRCCCGWEIISNNTTVECVNASWNRYYKLRRHMENERFRLRGGAITFPSQKKKM